MRKYFFILILIASVSCFPSRRYRNWLSPSPREQIINEAIDDQLGMGRLFVPAMSVSEWEPHIKIYDPSDMSVIDSYRPGNSVFLSPGRYTLLFGSSDDPVDMIQKHFTIHEHQTTIIEPDWSGLIVSVINENMEFMRYGYEILHFETGISAGTKYSREESVFDDMNTTWILPPGKYKMVKQGEPFNTIVNFATFDLKPGELKEMTVVINEIQQFIGAGELGILDKLGGTRKRDWYNVLSLKGSFTIYSHNKDGEDDIKTDIISQAKIDNKTIYDSKPYFLSIRQLLREEWSRTGSSDGFRISLDELSLINTGIYYFTNIFGLYGEINFRTKLFSTNYYDINREIRVVQADGDTLLMNDRNKFRTSESFTPIELEQRAGFNFTLIKTAYSNLYLRTGIGFVQTFNENVYSLTSSTASLLTFTELEDRFEKGLIFTAGGDFHITNNLTYSSTANLFYSLDEDRNYNLKWENDIILKLLRYVSIEYNFSLTYDYTKMSDNYLVFDNRLALELSYFINR